MRPPAWPTRASDVAFLWLPVPAGADLVTKVLYREERWVALPDDHRLAAEASVPWSELVDEQFIALPRAAGNLRDFWLATDQRPPDHPPRVVAEAANADEAYELIASGVGVAWYLRAMPASINVPVRAPSPCPSLAQ